MSTEVMKILAATETWPIDDQLDLVHSIWDRLLNSGWEPQLTEA